MFTLHREYLCNVIFLLCQTETHVVINKGTMRNKERFVLPHNPGISHMANESKYKNYEGRWDLNFQELGGCRIYKERNRQIE